MSSLDTARSPRRLVTILVASAVAATLSATALAHSSYLTTWRGVYPNSASDDNVINGTGSSCQLCHSSSGGGNGYNAYGWKIRELMQTMSTSAAIQGAASFDSDQDPTGSDNGTEIAADTQPGWTTGAVNTYYFNNGSTTGGHTAPSVQGLLDPPSCSVSTYCTAKVNSLGCTPSIGLSSTPSASAGSGCTLSTSSMLGGKLGIFIHSTSGPAAQPFHGGFLCLSSPLKRHAPASTGGTAGTCSGVLSEDFNAYIASHADPALVGGASVWIQAWSRDPGDAFGDNLSNAASVVICP